MTWFPGNLSELRGAFPHAGRLEWIGVRPARESDLTELSTVEASPDHGLEGDHYAGRSGNRQVTLLQSEHLPVIGGLLGTARPSPGLLRRNLVVAGINLLALKDRRFRIGTAVLEGTGYCHPCSRMETLLGPGGYNAMRGHGGITARVIEAGTMSVGDAVVALPSGG